MVFTLASQKFNFEEPSCVTFEPLDELGSILHEYDQQLLQAHAR